MSAAELFSPRNVCLAIIAITTVGFLVGITIAQRRHPEALDLPPRRLTAGAKALAYGAYFAGLGTWLARIVMGHDTSWKPAAVFLSGATVCVAMAIAAHRSGRGAATGVPAEQRLFDQRS